MVRVKLLFCFPFDSPHNRILSQNAFLHMWKSTSITYWKHLAHSAGENFAYTHHGLRTMGFSSMTLVLWLLSLWQPSFWFHHYVSEPIPRPASCHCVSICTKTCPVNVSYKKPLLGAVLWIQANAMSI
ncbi:hypothetical protein ILYODFUR_034451 [Ilyodon furcidens]|uniref:Uncharacterized protein n=1 Tax=Ilyodon furcidens TaxID=33524 RepID=A0ABV0VK63_9TELE